MVTTEQFSGDELFRFFELVQWQTDGVKFGPCKSTIPTRWFNPSAGALDETPYFTWSFFYAIPSELIEDGLKESDVVDKCKVELLEKLISDLNKNPVWLRSFPRWRIEHDFITSNTTVSLWFRFMQLNYTGPRKMEGCATEFLDLRDTVLKRYWPTVNWSY